MGERLDCIQEIGGSIPRDSTKTLQARRELGQERRAAREERRCDLDEGALAVGTAARRPSGELVAQPLEAIALTP